MRVEKQFTVAAPLDRAWEELLDAAHVAGCVPGGELRAASGERVFTGDLTLGSNGSAIQALGTLRPVDADEDEHTATLRVHGRQVAGPGRGSGLVRVRLGSAGDSTRVDLSADVIVAGAAPASDAVQQTAQTLLDGFAERLGERMAERARSAPAPAAEPDRPAREPETERPAAAAEPQRAASPSGLPAVLTGTPARAGLVLVLIALLRAAFGRRPKRVKVTFDLKW